MSSSGDAGVFFDDAEAAVAGDAVFDVDDVVADGEVAEVGDEGGGFGFAAADGAGGDVGVVDEILCAEDDDLAGGGLVEVEDLDAGGDGGLDDDRGAEVSGEVAGFAVDVGAAGCFAARAEAVGELVLLQEAGEAFDFALVGRGEEDAGFLLHERVECVDERGDGAVEALVGRVAKSTSERSLRSASRMSTAPSWSSSQPENLWRRSSRSQGER